MNRRNLLAVFGASVALPACSTNQLDPLAANAAKSYFAQSITVTPSATFIANVQTLKGGTPEELASAFARDVKTGLEGDLKGVMRGSSPATILIEFHSLDILDTNFSAVGLTVHSTVTIVDATTNSKIATFDVQADDDDMRNATNRDPMAALAGTLLLKAVVPAKNLSLWNLARVYRGEVKKRMGAKTFPGT